MITSKVKPYKTVSEIYDGLMSKVDYNHWANYLYSLVSPYLTDNARVLDLGAGNCAMTNKMITYYPSIVSADISINMLKKDMLNEKLKVCCDMTLLPFKQKFNLIYSTFDCVNYLLNKNSLESLFTETFRLLFPDGIFTFDVCLEENSKDSLKKQISEGSYSNIKFRQVSSYNRFSKIHKNSFTIFYPDGNIAREIHKQKIYSFDTYLRLIDSTGYSMLNCYETFSRKKASDKSNRVQFVLQKRDK
jgi:SAM-dependent methyltransferase